MTVSFFTYGQDTVDTIGVDVPRNVNFSDEYVQAHQDQFMVDIPEVSELVNIMIMVSERGQVDSTMSDYGHPYHQRVMEYFLPFQNHPTIDTINQHMPQNYNYENYEDYNMGYWYFYGLRMNACGYVFDAEDNIVDNGIIHKMGFDETEEPFETHADLFADFAKQSDFRAFYAEHKSYYDSLVTYYKKWNPINKMKE